MTSKDTEKYTLINNGISDKKPSIIYAHLESMINKIDRFKNNLEKSSTTKVTAHINYHSQG